MLKDKWKFHKYYEILESRLRRLKEGELCEEVNQKYFLDYTDFLYAEGLTVPRVSKCLRLALKPDQVLKKDLKLINRNDVIHYLGWLEKGKYTEWTKCDFRSGFKKFMRWLYNNKLPDFMDLVKCNVRNQNKMLPQEVLIETEVVKMINETYNTRDKALLSCLYESGCRIGELVTLKIKHVEFDEYGCVMNVNGKTGVRRVRIISSTSALSQWLTDHPTREDEDSYVWCSFKYEDNGLISYEYVRKLLKQAAKRAGVKKKVNPHAFRHARCTHLASKLTEAQMKMYFGWTQSSKMAAVYVHLSGRDVDNAILELHGVKKKEEAKNTFSPKKCRCGQNNSPANKYCSKCGQILDINLQLEVEEQRNKLEEFMKELIKKPELMKQFQEVIKA